MCIIAAKPRNTAMPSDELINNMWNRNKDGAGLMYVKNGAVVIEKGFMKLKDLKGRLDALGEELDLTATPVVLHFRITTHGGTKPENCHPFPVSDSVGILSKLKITTSLGVAHNGIIDITPRKGISDTMEYIITQLYPLYKAMPKFYENKWAMKLVANGIDSKMALLNKKGDIYTIGDFIEKDGIMYSNSSYEGWAHYNDFKYGSYSSGGWNYGWSREIDNDDVFKDRSWHTDSQYEELMFLDEFDGYYVTIDGESYVGEYAMDRENNVYEYDENWGDWVLLPYARAKSKDDKDAIFDEDGWVTKELVAR